MTANQLKFLEYQENVRANKAAEGLKHDANSETARANLAREAETHRSNRWNEWELHRSNTTREKETERANLAREKETWRSNRIKEQMEEELLSSRKQNIQADTAAKAAAANKATADAAWNWTKLLPWSD